MVEAKGSRRRLSRTLKTILLPAILQNTILGQLYVRWQKFVTTRGIRSVWCYPFPFSTRATVSRAKALDGCATQMRVIIVSRTTRQIGSHLLNPIVRNADFSRHPFEAFRNRVTIIICTYVPCHRSQRRLWSALDTLHCFYNNYLDTIYKTSPCEQVWFKHLM